jgi:hypothetical protein
MSEYVLPELPLKAPILTPTPSEKKAILINSVQSSTTPKSIVLPPSQNPISVFLTPSKSVSPLTSLASRKSSLIDRIRAKSSIKSVSADDSAKDAAWDRGEWIIASLFMYGLFLQHD